MQSLSSHYSLPLGFYPLLFFPKGMTEAEERECRICRGNDEPGRPLFHPCRCSGSIKYTHEDCLVNWLSQSGSARCELCNHSFRFEPLYQPNTPIALSAKEFVLGILALTRKAFYTVSRIILVSAVWLFCLPVGTCWTWYALFINSPMQLPKWIISRGWGGLVLDAFYGFLLSAGIVFVFLGVSSLREYIRQFPNDPLDAQENIDANIDVANDDQDRAVFDNQPLGYDADDENLPDDNDDTQEERGDNQFNQYRNENNPRHRRNPNWGRRHHRDHMDDDEVLNQVDELVRDTFDDIAGADESDEDIVEAGPMLGNDTDEDANPIYAHFHSEEEPRPGTPFPANVTYSNSDSSSLEHVVGERFHERAVGVGNFEHDSESADMDADSAEDDHPFELPANDDREADGQEGREGGALFGLFDLDPDEVPLEEVVGLRGQLRNLFDNALTVLFSNAVFLGIFTLIPLLFGRLTLRTLSMRSFPISLRVSSLFSFGAKLTNGVGKIPSRGFSAHWNMSDISGSNTSLPIMTLLMSEVSSMRLFFKSPQVTSLPDVTKISKEVIPSPLATSVSTVQPEMPTVSYLDNFLIVLLGYGVIVLCAIGYIGVMSALKHRYPQLETPFTKHVARTLRYLATFVKIVVLILFEFGLFPLGCGWWLDVCTLDILGASLQSRLTYCHDSPWICTGVHWLIGITYMVQISLFVSLVRELIRPELLWFLRNPDDPDFHPFRELVEKPLSRHARRLLFSVAIYMPLVVAFVYIPAQICLKALPTVFPFISEDFSHILIDVPFGNLLLGPLLHPLYIGRPEFSVQKFAGIWVKWVATSLGIADVVVKDDNNGREEVDNGLPNDGRGEVLVQDDTAMNDAVIDEMLPEDDMHFDDGASDDEQIMNTTLLGSRPGNTEMEANYNRRRKRFRGALMIFIAWVTIVAIECGMISIPTIIGRKAMGAIGLPVRHDLHPFLLGLNIFLGLVSLFIKGGKYLGTLGPVTVVVTGMPYLATGLRGLVVLLLGFGVVPLATGLLFELILVPFRIGDNETPYFCMHQDWALGLLLLKVWACVAVTGGLGGVWRERVLRFRDWELAGLDRHFGRLLKDVLLPVLTPLITILSVPYTIARGLLPALGAARWISNWVYRYSYLAIASWYCGRESTRYLVSLLRDLHDSIRDEKYLVGKRLYNFNGGRE